MGRRAGIALSAALIAGVGGAGLSLARSPATSRPTSKTHSGARTTVIVRDVPHIQQRPDFCGEACAAMYLGALGHPHSQNDVFNAAGVDPRAGRGAYTTELARALEGIGFDIGRVWATVEVAQANRQLQILLGELLDDLQMGVPSIVCMRYDHSPKTTEHFRLVLGYDASRAEIIYHEPAEADGGYRRMSRASFLRLWPLKYSIERWTVVRLRLSPQKIRPPVRHPGFSPAEVAQHILALRERLPDEAFTIALAPPFVVIGDEPPHIVERRAEQTVLWAVQRLKQDFFAADPTTILDVWLFKSAASYETYAKELFGHRLDTPFGYYSSADRALVMNISTGGGTLVHEIVHPFMEANFPDCPPWFNEGLGSLYEQSTDREGHIWGLTNWRLGGLQQSIRAGALPSFRALTHQSEADFYRDDSGTNYAQSRYLLYYLQQQGLLPDYYRRFRSNRGRDPTGFETLRAVLGVKDMVQFQRRWERYVLELRFPPST